MHDDLHTLLLVSADGGRAANLGEHLLVDGFDVVHADDAAMGLRSLERAYPDVVVVDARLPGDTGLRVLAGVRGADPATSRVDPQTPVLVLLDRDDPVDRVRALERGADDVLALPLHYPELLARLRAVLRRAAQRPGAGFLRIGDLTLDPIARVVQIAGDPIELSAKEFALLHVLAAEPTRVFSKEELLRKVWGFESASRTRTLDSHACRLRLKLQAAAGGRYVVNVWGIGYKLLDRASAGGDAGRDARRRGGATSTLVGIA